jgi:hypothetical protein
VCKCEMDEGEDVLVIPVCKHVFHEECLSKWLRLQVSTKPTYTIGYGVYVYYTNSYSNVCICNPLSLPTPLSLCTCRASVPCAAHL